MSRDSCQRCHATSHPRRLPIRPSPEPVLLFAYRMERRFARRTEGVARRRCQPVELAAVRETGLMWANALRAFQVGKARTS